MPDKHDKTIKFWQELKRRKVYKVITMYAGMAFIILQLIDIIAKPLQLPTWTKTLVIVLLCIGFIITLLIAWIYDITPVYISQEEYDQIASSPNETGSQYQMNRNGNKHGKRNGQR